MRQTMNDLFYSLVKLSITGHYFLSFTSEAEGHSLTGATLRSSLHYSFSYWRPLLGFLYFQAKQ